jgi:hypothetical protein
MSASAWNGGGKCYRSHLYNSGSGGGGTDIRMSRNNAYNDRIIVAGGGSGAIDGVNYNGSSSGANGTGNAYATAGKAGTNTEGGTAGGVCGNSGDGIKQASTPGIFGIGGDAGYSNVTECDSGSGGGGGYYGGGGGGAGQQGATGGGGSNWSDPDIISETSRTNAKNSGNGVARICWGNRIEECNGTAP